MQSSVKQIASVFRGNPAPLQQRVNQDKQANQGIPADLKELLALQILTEERDSASRQKAIQQLQQTGQQPTVAQSLQQRAQQAIQAKTVQEQRNQQGLQGLMQQLGSGAVPENTPQPQRQPQGIDQLPAGMDEFSGGGIVAFNGEDGSDVKSKYDRERENREPGKPLDAQAAKDRAALTRLLEVLRGGSESAGRAIADVATVIPRSLASAYDTVAVRPMRAAGIDAAYLAPKLTPEGVSTGSATPFTDVATMRDAKKTVAATDQTAADNRTMINKADASLRSAPPERKVPPVISSPERKTPPAIPTDKPVVPADPAAGGLGDLITPDVRAKRQQIMFDAMKLDPKEAERLRREAYDREVGAPQTAGLEQLAQELKDRRAKMQERNKNIDPLVERLSAIANTPRGQKWMYSMLAGNAAVDKAQQARETQDFEMLKQIVEQQNKIEDVKRGYRAETFAIGDKERNRVYKDAFEAAKELGVDDRAATQLAQEAVLRLQQMANSLKVAQVNASRENQTEARNKQYLDLRNRARVLRDAGKIADADRLEAQAADIMAITGRAGSTTDRGATPTDRLRAAQSILEDIDSTPAEKAAARIEITNIMSGMKQGAGASSAASGKVPPPPPGFKLN
jgi:hypothetical protein